MFYLNDTVISEYTGPASSSIKIAYKIVRIEFVNEQPVYVLRHADGGLERDIYCTLRDTDHIKYRKVADGTDGRNDYQG